MDKIFNNIKKPLSGSITIPSDKSVTHRAIILSSILAYQTKQPIETENISLGKDCLNTLKIFNELGIKTEFKDKKNIVQSFDFEFDKNKQYNFDCGNSGTTTRLLAGLFSSIEGLNCVLDGDDSLKKRPMKRIIEPLNLMGADISSNDNKVPLTIKGKKLNPLQYNSKIPSAQVKSAIILAGLNIEDETTVIESDLSRNHTELMLEYLGADIKYGKNESGFYTTIKKSNLSPKKLIVPGDISSAAFFMVAAAITIGSKILVKNVGINPTRAGILEIFKKANVDFTLRNLRTVANESVADILVEYSPNMETFEIYGDIVPRLIDEIPVLAILASCIDGYSVIKDAGDLRNKESDRIKNIVQSLSAIGVEIYEQQDGFIIRGNSKKVPRKDITFETHLDHRLAMSYYVLSLLNRGQTTIQGFECVDTSFPEFLELFNLLG